MDTPAAPSWFPPSAHYDAAEYARQLEQGA
jgi:hypothetical protein